MSTYADVSGLVDGRRRRRHILELADQSHGEADPGDIVDDLERLGFLRRHGGRLGWTGPESPDLLCRLVALRDGPARSLVEVPADGACPVTIYAASEDEGAAAHLAGWGGACGTGIGRRTAAVSCLYETAERCAQVRHGDEETHTAAFSDIADGAIHPDRLLGVASDDQIPRSPTSSTPIMPLAPDLPISWTAGRHLISGKPFWLPTDFCYRSARCEGRAWTCPADSGGCSTGHSPEDVAVRGFLELVERDAVAIWWYNRVGRPGVSLEFTDLPPVQSIAAWQQERGRSFHLLDLTTDLGVPVVAAVSYASDGCGIAVGFGASFDPRIAVLRASLEMTQFLVMVELSLSLRVDDATHATRAAWSWFEGTSIATEPYLMPRKDDAATKPAWADDPPGDPEAAMSRCLAIAARHGLDLLFIDMTRSWTGIPAGRVIVPGLLPTRLRAGARRLYDVPVKLGWISSARHRDELNAKAMVF